MSSPACSAELDRLLADGETVLWHATPQRHSLVAQQLVYGAVAVPFLGPFAFFPLLFAVFAVAAAVDSLPVLVLGVVAAGVLALLAVFGGVYLVARRTHAHAEYAATDRRLVSFGGVIGRDYSSVDWDAVQDIEVSVGWLDGRYGTGTVSATAAGSGGVQFAYVSDPYDVLERLESIRRGGNG